MLVLTCVRAGLFHRSVISLRFSGRSSSWSAWAASSKLRQNGSSHTGFALNSQRPLYKREQQKLNKLDFQKATAVSSCSKTIKLLFICFVSSRRKCDNMSLRSGNFTQHFLLLPLAFQQHAGDRKAKYSLYNVSSAHTECLF